MRTKTLSPEEARVVRAVIDATSFERVAVDAHVSVPTVRRLLNGGASNAVTHFAVVEAARRLHGEVVGRG